MDNAMRTVAENAARLLLDEYRVAHPGWGDERTPIDDLVRWVGLEVETFHPADYEQGVHGFVDPDEDENLIWLRRDLQEAFRRFTLAHELGHAILHCHGGERLALLAQRYSTALNLAPFQQELADLPEPSRNDPCADDDIQEDMTGVLDEEQFQETLGIGQSYDPRSQRELAANIFAAEVLLPRERVLTCYTSMLIDPHALPGRFGVSQAALLNRLAGMLKPVPAMLPVASPDEGKPTAKRRYDEFQQAAIEASTPALIVAGPGSGKTSTLIGRTEYLIRTLGVAPQSILALTFSRKAAQEMEERLGLVLLQYPLTDRKNQKTLTSLPKLPDMDDSSGTMPNMSSGFALGDAYQLPKVSTFHAFCADILRQHATLVGLRADFALIDEAEGYFLLRQQANAMRLRHYRNLPYPTQAFPDMLKAISRAKDELVTPERYAQLAQAMGERADGDEEREQAEKALEIAHVYQLYEQELARRGDSDFGGLLMLTLRLFAEHPLVLAEVQARYQQILVDEFQDVNRASGVLLRELAGVERRVWVVGDSNQAIYGFRGASPANISQFEEDFPGAVVLPLSRNYRSRPDLVTLAEAFRCKHLEVGQEPGKNRAARLSASAEPDVTLATASDESYEMAGMLRDIRRKLAEGYHYHDIVVLCRTRSQVQKFTQALANAQLPVIERGGMLEQAHIKDVLSMLLLLTDASGKGLLRAARQPEHPLSQQDIEGVLLAARNPKTTPRQLLLDADVPLGMSEEGRRSFLYISQIVRTLVAGATSVQNSNVWTMLAQYLFLESSRVRDELAQGQLSGGGGLPESVQDPHPPTPLPRPLRENPKQPGELLVDYDRLLQLARHYDQQQARRAIDGSDDGTEKTQVEYLDGFLEYLSLLVLLRQDGGNRQSSSEDEGESADILRVMTVHASKGLEFPVVYIPEVVQQRFPLSNRSSSIVYPEGMLPAGCEGKVAHESGESCLFYVGVTRARDHLVLSYSERYGKRAYKRSPYLDALEGVLPAERINKLSWNEQRVLSFTGAQGERPVIASSQPGEDFINAMRPPTLSTSAIEGYLRCPRQYAYSNIYHFADEPDGYRLFWQTTQKLIEEIHDHFSEENAHLAKQALSPERLQERYTQYWQEAGGHEEPFAPMYERHGQEIVEALRRRLTLQEEERWDLRRSFTVSVAGKTVHVTVDRVEASQEGQVPTRFVRTRMKGKREKEKPEVDMRELFYTLAYRQQYPGQPVELYSHNMSTGETVPLKMTAKKEQSLYESAQQAVEGLERNDYAARPAQPFRCPQCPFFFICPA